MHESHIHSFLTHFPFICYKYIDFWPLPISRANGFISLPPLTLTSFKAMYVTLKRPVLKNRNCGFVPGKDNFDCIEVSIHTVHTQQNQYLGVFHLSGIPFSFPIIILSEISQPDYVHLNMCNNVPIMHPNSKIDETRYFVWSISV